MGKEEKEVARKVAAALKKVPLERQINILNFAQGVAVGAEIDRKKTTKEGAA